VLVETRLPVLAWTSRGRSVSVEQAAETPPAADRENGQKNPSGDVVAQMATGPALTRT
jgi:hypothetical protein